MIIGWQLNTSVALKTRRSRSVGVNKEPSCVFFSTEVCSSLYRAVSNIDVRQHITEPFIMLPSLSKPALSGLFWNSESVATGLFTRLQVSK